MSTSVGLESTVQINAPKNVEKNAENCLFSPAEICGL